MFVRQCTPATAEGYACQACCFFPGSRLHSAGSCSAFLCSSLDQVRSALLARVGANKLLMPTEVLLDLGHPFIPKQFP
jgi:hypothetical protein